MKITALIFILLGVVDLVIVSKSAAASNTLFGLALPWMLLFIGAGLLVTEFFSKNLESDHEEPKAPQH